MTTNDPTFLLYAISCLVLCANLLFLWGYSGAVRARSKTVINPEDARTVASGAAVVAVDPPDVARVLRAHSNAMAVVVPFAIVGLLFVLAGGSTTLAAVLFGAFVVLRLAHSAVYLAELQPWRTITFAASALALLVLMGDVVWLMV